MSTRTDWGWFDKDGKPIAVGDEWHKWVCPQHHWERPIWEHPITGEPYEAEDAVRVMGCKMKYIEPKLEVCEVCGNKFIYP